MRKSFRKHKNKVLLVLFLVALPWAIVAYLELKINNQSIGSFEVLEDGLCLSIPKGCSFQKAPSHLGIICRDGSVATITATAGLASENSLVKIKSFKIKSGEVYVSKDPLQSSVSKTTYWIDSPSKNYKAVVLFKTKDLSLLGKPDHCMAYYKN